MKRFLFALFTAHMIALSILCAQQVLISGNITVPTGDFGKDIGENPLLRERAGFDIGKNVGLAETGFGAGAELITPVTLGGLDWILSARLLTNSSNIAAIETEFEHQLGDTVDIEFEYGNWINIPVMTGFRYNYSLAPNFSMHALIQVGINVSKAATRKATREIAGMDSTVEETSFEFARDFGVEFGLGIELANKFNLGVRYLALNSPRYEGTRKLSEKQFPGIFSRESAILGEQRSISMILVTLGYYLF
jgi:hypothetical protein